MNDIDLVIITVIALGVFFLILAYFVIDQFVYSGIGAFVFSLILYVYKKKQ